MRFLYGEQGKYSRAEEMTAPTAVASASGDPVAMGGCGVTALAGIADRKRSARRVPPRPNRAGCSAPCALRNPLPPARPRSPAFSAVAPAFFDYDGDGRPDIFLVNGDGQGHAALYRNMGGGRFANVTKQAGIDFHGEGMGCAVGDYDNDGRPDLVISSRIGIALFHNEGHRTFKDVTDAAGVRMEGLALGVTFIDYDQDGDLDLYVTRFADFPLGDPSTPFAFPTDAPGEGNMLWRNKGDGTFVDATKEMDLAGSAPSVGAIGTHLRNGSIDLVLTGWQKSPTVMLNTREGAFRSASPWAAEMPGPTAGAVAFDFDQDGTMDLAFTHWSPPGPEPVAQQRTQERARRGRKAFRARRSARSGVDARMGPGGI